MTAPIKSLIAIQKSLIDQAENLAQQLNTSQTHILNIAIEHFFKQYQGQTLLDEITKAQQTASHPANQYEKTETEVAVHQNTINQGDIYWVPLLESDGATPSYTHPHVVIQDNLLNHSRIHTVVVCALTSNINRISAPGNLLLEAGEASLPKPSVVEVSKITAVDKQQLGQYIGSLTQERINQIFAGMKFMQTISKNH